MIRLLGGVALAIALLACGGSRQQVPERRVATALGQDLKGSGGERCDGSAPNREVSEYDSSGDDRPDVRKVYVALGREAETRLVMICREIDLNADGIKDVIRYYDDEGRTLREESDRDFDGKMDVSLVYQDGQIERKESDDDRDGDIDSKVYYEDGKPLRIERDLAGRSGRASFRPDRWEYYEDGRMVRMGTDLDGDGRVDRWDRDAAYRSEQDGAPEVQAAADTATESAASAAEPGASPDAN